MKTPENEQESGIEWHRLEDFERAVAFCNDCKEVIGPGWSEDVGAEMAIGEHEGHDTEILKEWTITVPVPEKKLYGTY